MRRLVKPPLHSSLPVLLCASVIILCASALRAFAAPDIPAPTETEGVVVKVAGIVKQSGENDAAKPDYSRGGAARWTVLKRNTDACRAVVVGSRPATDGQRLAGSAFQPLNPPSLATALGLATVSGPDDAGWFLAAGGRCIVKPTGGMREGATLAYASWASAGWMIGVAPDAPAAARVLWDTGSGNAIDLKDALASAVAEAPDTGAWLVAGQVVFEHSMGQGLDRSPTEQPRNARFDPQDPTRSLLSPTPSDRASAFLVACVASSDSPIGAAILERFAAEGDALGTGSKPNARFLAHFALLEKPAPAIDPERALEALWEERFPNDPTPHPATLRRALEGCRISQGLLNVYAVQAVELYRFPQGPDLVDITTLDDTFLTDHQWSRPNPLFDHALVRNGTILLRRPVARALVCVHERLKQQGYRLKIHDGYRPFAISRALYRSHPYAAYLAHPELGSRHNRGAAVDCTLVGADGRDVEMPSPVLTFNKSSDRLRETMSDAARQHLDILTNAMAAEGFTTIKSEWWHYDGPDWERYPVLNVPVGDVLDDAVAAPIAAAATPETELANDGPLVPTEVAPRSRNPFDRPSDTPLPAPEARPTYQRESVADAPPPLPAPTAQTAATPETNTPFLPLPILVGTWIVILVILLALLFLRPRTR